MGTLRGSARQSHLAAVCAAALAALALAGCSAATTGRGQLQPAVVDHVVDGDTLEVRLGAERLRVRTLQIDAPESSTLRFGHADRCGAPAKAYAESLVRRGSRVTLELAGSERHDRYGRLLALVHLGGPDAVTWQERMTRAGWAQVLVVHENSSWLTARLQADQSYARRHRLGVYRRCAGRFHEQG